MGPQRRIILTTEAYIGNAADRLDDAGLFPEGTGAAPAPAGLFPKATLAAGAADDDAADAPMELESLPPVEPAPPEPPSGDPRGSACVGAGGYSELGLGPGFGVLCVVMAVQCPILGP